MNLETRHVEDVPQVVALMMLQSGEAFRMKLFFPHHLQEFYTSQSQLLSQIDAPSTREAFDLQGS